MHVVIITEQDGKIVLTKDELQKMLDDAFAKGYEEGKIVGRTYYNTWPIITTTAWNSTNKDNVYCSNVATNESHSVGMLNEKPRLK